MGSILTILRVREGGPLRVGEGGPLRVGEGVPHEKLRGGGQLPMLAGLRERRRMPLGSWRSRQRRGNKPQLQKSFKLSGVFRGAARSRSPYSPLPLGIFTVYPHYNSTALIEETLWFCLFRT